MPGTPTANHAHTLFFLTMEDRYGRNWRTTVAPQDIARLAGEVAAGFGGHAEGDDAKHPTVWRFPDGSCAHTGDFGLRHQTDRAA